MNSLLFGLETLVAQLLGTSQSHDTVGLCKGVNPSLREAFLTNSSTGLEPRLLQNPPWLQLLCLVAWHAMDRETDVTVSSSLGL